MRLWGRGESEVWGVCTQMLSASFALAGVPAGGIIFLRCIACTRVGVRICLRVCLETICQRINNIILPQPVHVPIMVIMGGESLDKYAPLIAGG